LELKTEGIKNIMELKVGDEVEIIIHCLCGAGNQKFMTGIINNLVNTSYCIHMPKHIEKTGRGYWYHSRNCLRLVNKGFNPDKIISEAFGGVK